MRPRDVEAFLSPEVTIAFIGADGKREVVLDAHTQLGQTLGESIAIAVPGPRSH